jgi:uncharacterized protein (DUF2252 family)
MTASPASKLQATSPGERRKSGRALRNRVPRTSHGNWEPRPGRPDPVDFMEKADAGRVRSLLPIKVTRMSLSPFAFFRGAAHLMADDLAATPVTGVTTQICGDAHVQNIGAFSAPDGHMVFDLNDFDETIPGPWEWDVKRLAASLVLAGREAGDSEQSCEDAAGAFMESYRENMAKLSELTYLETLRYEVRRMLGSGPAHLALSRAERSTPEHTLQKLTTSSARQGPRFHDRPPLLAHVPEQQARTCIGALGAYRETLSPDRQLAFDAYKPVDVAFKVVGTGSVGTRDFIVLFFGRGLADPLVLQVKQELESCYQAYLPNVPPFPHQGRRVAEGQHRMQSATDPFLGWASVDGLDYLVRQLADHKGKIEVEDLKGRSLALYAMVAGDILAKAHARTGDSAAIAGYCGGSDRMDRAMAKFATRYADQTEKDYALFRKAIRSGRLKAAPRREALGR